MFIDIYSNFIFVIGGATMLNKQPENINEQQYDEIDKALEEATRSLPRQKVTEADMVEMIKNGEW